MKRQKKMKINGNIFASHYFFSFCLSFISFFQNMVPFFLGFLFYFLGFLPPIFNAKMKNFSFSCIFSKIQIHFLPPLRYRTPHYFHWYVHLQLEQSIRKTEEHSFFIKNIFLADQRTYQKTRNPVFASWLGFSSQSKVSLLEVNHLSWTRKGPKNGREESNSTQLAGKICENQSDIHSNAAHNKLASISLIIKQASEKCMDTDTHLKPLQMLFLPSKL